MAGTVLARCKTPCPPIPLPGGSLLTTGFNCTRVSGHAGAHSILIEWPNHIDKTPPATSPSSPQESASDRSADSSTGGRSSPSA